MVRFLKERHFKNVVIIQVCIGIDRSRNTILVNACSLLNNDNKNNIVNANAYNNNNRVPFLFGHFEWSGDRHSVAD